MENDCLGEGRHADALPDRAGSFSGFLRNRPSAGFILLAAGGKYGEDRKGQMPRQYAAIQVFLLMVDRPGAR